MKHSRPLDGLRGLAILLVILFHFGFLGAGWIGVQVFFVLSGYLITSILVADRGRPAVHYFKRFYWRRSLRIFPLYFGYLFVLALVFAILKLPVEFGDRWLYLFTYTYNYALLIVPLKQSVSFTHFWSLAVEEQFYLLWPLVVYFVSGRSLKAVIVAVLLMTPVIRYLAVLYAQVAVPGHEQPGLYAYSPLPAQWDSLATGAALAVMGIERIRRPLRWFGAATVLALGAGLVNSWDGGAGLTGGTTFGYAPFAIDNYQHVWSYTLVNLWAAALLVGVMQVRWLSQVFAHPVLTYSGQISYGLYVLHYPLLGLVKQAVFFHPFSLEGLAVFVLYSAALYAVAALSFRFFEAPLLAFKDRIPGTST